MGGRGFQRPNNFKTFESKLLFCKRQEGAKSWAKISFPSADIIVSVPKEFGAKCTDMTSRGYLVALPSLVEVATPSIQNR